MGGQVELSGQGGVEAALLEGFGENAVADRLVALEEGVGAALNRDDGGGGGQDGQGDQGGHRRPASPDGAPVLPVGVVQEPPLQWGELGSMLGRPQARHLEASAAIQRRCLALVPVPDRGGFGEVLVDEVAGPVLVDPALQPGPGGEQRLVGDDDAVALLSEQPAPGEDLHDVPGKRRVAQVVQQLVLRHPPANVVRRRADLHQPQEQGLGQLPGRRSEIGEEPLGGGRDGVPDSTGRQISIHGELMAVPSLLLHRFS